MTYEKKTYNKPYKKSSRTERLTVMTYEKKTYNKPYKKSSRTENAHAYKSKRGKLAPLMTEEAKQGASIHELSYDFGCRITRLFQ